MDILPIFFLKLCVSVPVFLSIYTYTQTHAHIHMNMLISYSSKQNYGLHIFLPIIALINLRVLICKGNIAIGLTFSLIIKSGMIIHVNLRRHTWHSVSTRSLFQLCLIYANSVPDPVIQTQSLKESVL